MITRRFPMYVHLQKFFIHALFFCCIPIIAFGTTETFPVQTLVGSDTEAPTVPTGLTATGISTSQIDLSWSSSTDNFLLSGYHVWRQDVNTGTTTSTTPSVRIATTTTPFYSDTGLTASTSYVYYVTSFDSVFNESASSSVATGTTLSTSSPETEEEAEADGTTQGTRRRAFEEQIASLQLYPQKDSVILQFETKGYIRSVIKWGTSISYELGSLSERAFSKRHETTIVGLLPGKRYAYVIEGELPNGRYGVLHIGTFVTLAPDDTVPPGNVTQLRATIQNNDVSLTWNNPLDQDFSHVRIVRNDQFYPSDIADGWVVYEGSDAAYVDRGALSNSKVQFYTVFAYDALGNISSGAVVSVSRTPGTVIVEPDPAKNPLGLTFEQIHFFQEENQLIIKEGSVLIDGTKQLVIRVPYTLFPEHLKTILVTLEHPDNADETFSFLLRINKDKTAYESILAPLGISGSFPVRLSVFDYETQQIGYTDGTIISHIGMSTPEAGVFVPVLSPDAKLLRTLVGILGWVFLVCVGVWFAKKTFVVVRK